MAFSVVQECLSFRIVKTTLFLTFFFIRNPHSAHARTHFHNILSVFLSLSFSCKTCRGIPLKIKKLTRVISKNVVHTQEYIFVFVFYSNENVSSLLFYFVREKKKINATGSKHYRPRRDGALPTRFFLLIVGPPERAAFLTSSSPHDSCTMYIFSFFGYHISTELLNVSYVSCKYVRRTDAEFVKLFFFHSLN